MTWAMPEGVEPGEVDALTTLLPAGESGMVVTAVLCVLYIDERGRPVYMHSDWGDEGVLATVGLLEMVKQHIAIRPHVLDHHPGVDPNKPLPDADE